MWGVENLGKEEMKGGRRRQAKTDHRKTQSKKQGGTVALELAAGTWDY